LATIKKIFSYALDVGVVPVNPATGIKPPAKENVKDRVLNLNDLATMFRVLETQDNRDTRDILQLIALTAQRPGEVAEMRISQLKEETDGTWWTMAGSDVKNKTAHRVYLNDQALRIIQNRIKDYEMDNYVFPTIKRDGSISFMRKDVIVKRVHKIMPLLEAEGIEKFTAHDLRRSAATGIAQLGHSAVVPDILNHKPQGITRQVYDKYSRQPEIKLALVALGEALQRAINGTQADVIEIKTANQS
jgi:integrase